MGKVERPAYLTFILVLRQVEDKGAHMKEVWKDIPGYKGLYQVSNLGRVKSLSRTTLASNGVKRCYPEKMLTPFKNSGERESYHGYHWEFI